jgi:hypothetical protein
VYGAFVTDTPIIFPRGVTVDTNGVITYIGSTAITSPADLEVYFTLTWMLTG